MMALAFAIERLVLRYLINQEGIILFMATIGITFFLDGFGQTLWGSDIYEIDLFLPKDPIFLFEDMFPGGLLVDPYELLAAVIAGLLVVVLAVFFQKTRVGRRSEEHTSELQSLMRISYAVFCLNKKTKHVHQTTHIIQLI